MERKDLLILDKEFLEYCDLNEIENVQEFAKKVFDKGFNIIKYGYNPSNEDFIKEIKKEKEKIKNGETPAERYSKVLREIEKEMKEEEGDDIYNE